MNPFVVGIIHLKPPESTLVSEICKLSPTCIDTCHCQMYYVMCKIDIMTIACIHLRHHNHPVSLGVCRDALDNIWSLLGQDVSKTPTAKTFVIAFAASKEFLSSFLLHDNENVNDNGPSTLKGSLLNDVMDQYTVLSYFNICNINSSFHLQFGGKGCVNNILELKKRSTHDFFFKRVYSQAKVQKKFISSRCQLKAQGAELIE